MAGTIRVNLLTNSAPATGAAFPIPSGKYGFMVDANFGGGGNVKLQVQNPQGTWIDVDGASALANKMIPLDLPAGQYRAVGATATAIYAHLVTIQSAVRG